MNNLILIAGPCLAESKEMLIQSVEHLLNICSKYNNIDFYFKASYKKANRTSYSSVSGVGDSIALQWLGDIRKEYNIKVLTDIHSIEEVKLAKEYVDVLQIPAFLCRQTELLVEAGKTNFPVNIKKGQFVAPDDMKKAAEKITAIGNKNVWITERGTCFGYHDLVVDFRSLIIMKEYGFPVIYDATHSVQQPSIGEQSGGNPQFIFPLAKAAIAVGVDGIFFETHPNPLKAKSDSKTQIPLTDAGNFVNMIINSL
jgi:2-dehydro-3-deoxyphosphooctonate aldolase (KDO 8-P synthase)